MINLNKNLPIFIGTILLVSVSSFYLLDKLPRLISHATYYCQSTIVSLLTPVPPQLILLPFIIFSFFTLLAFTKLVLIVIKSHNLKNKLIKNLKTQKGFNMLLKKLDLEKTTFLIENDKPFAFCLGIIKPKIYISTALLQIVDLKELEVILHHEKYHIKNRDTLTMVIGILSTTFIPFLPVLSDLLHNYHVERELQADKEAIKRSGGPNKLVSVLKKLLNNPSPSFTFAPAIIGHDTLEPRIAAIINSNHSNFGKFKLSNLIVSIFFIITIVFAIAGPIHAMHIHAEDTHIIMLHPREDECLSWGENLSVHPH